MKNAPIPLRSKNKVELLKRIAELETRGFELLSQPIEVLDKRYTVNGFNHQSKRNDVSTIAISFWFAKMGRKKV